MEDSKQQRKMAMMIDGDNAQPSMLDKIIAEAAKYGTLTIKRIFGDWTTQRMSGWKNKLNHHAVQPVQQFMYTVGKNATDSAMIIDAMDILHGGQVDAFCIVSSDSDYTRLATRIREAGIFVMGVGEQKTPKPFVNACNLFIYTENLEVDDDDMDEDNKGKKDSSSKKKGKNSVKKKSANPLPLVKKAYFKASGGDDWIHLSHLGNYIQQLDPSFDPRTYGHKTLTQIIKSLSPHFELRFREKDGWTHVLTRLAPKAKK
ncbi:MAG: NYN domain-containing protein [bacterium]